MTTHSQLSRALFVFVAAVFSAQADVKMPSIFSSHMVLQRDEACPVWGWAEAGEEVTVTIGAQKHTAKTGDNGKWSVKLTAMKASSDDAKT